MLGLGLEVGLPLSAPGSTPSTLDRVVGGGRGEEAPTEAAAAAEAVEAVGAVEAEAAAAAAGAATASAEEVEEGEVVVEAAGAGQS